MNRIFAVSVAAILLIGPAIQAAKFSGTVDRGVDGDTLWVCDVTACHKIRLCGADAPEKGEPGYREAPRL